MSSQRDPKGTTVEGLCRKVGMSRQAYYKGCRQRSREQVDREGILELVRAQRRIHPCMGARKLKVVIEPELKEMGISIGRDRFFALLEASNLLVKRKRRRARTTYSGHAWRVYPNLVREMQLSAPDQLWVSDLTYIRTDEGFLYLSLITDAYSRKIIGYDVSDSLEAEGCLRSLQQALSGLPQGAAPIHHSDRGTQYCCEAYVDLLKQHGVSISMTEENHCYENAKAERVNGILKQEYALGQCFRTKPQGIAAAHQAIPIYNELRPHLSLGYRTPSWVHAQANAA